MLLIDLLVCIYTFTSAQIDKYCKEKYIEETSQMLYKRVSQHLDTCNCFSKHLKNNLGFSNHYRNNHQKTGIPILKVEVLKVCENLEERLFWESTF